MALITESKLLNAQVSLLGSICFEPEIVGEVMLRVAPEHFTTPIYRHIFEAIARLWANQEPIDVLTIDHALGGDYHETLSEIMMNTVTSAHWEKYVAIVVEESRLYQLQQLGSRLREAETLDDARAAAEQINRLMVERPSTKVVTLAQGLKEFLEQQESKEPVKYIPWGIPKLDEALTIEPGDFVILGGEPSSGKTALAIQFANTMAAQGYRVGVFSLETSDRKVFARWVAQTAGVPLKRIKRKTLTDSDLGEIVKLGRVVGRRQIDVIPAAYFTVADIQAIALSRRYDVMIIDYIQIIRAPGVPRYEAVTEISIALHTMAQVTGITVVGLSQLSRPEKGVKRREAKMSDLRESGQLEQDADAIMIVQGRGAGERVLSLVKNKEGDCGKIALTFDADRVRFLPAHRSDPDDDEDDEPRRRHQGARSRP